MHRISTRVHGMLDYPLGLLLIISPWLFGFADETGVARWLPFVLGASVLVYSMLTRYEFALSPVIPMPVHLGLDAIGGLLLAVSPWLFGFADRVWLPHLVFGLLEIGAAVSTRMTPEPAFRQANS
jgi:hypothetical protein